MKTWNEVVEGYRERWLKIFNHGVEGFSEQACREIVIAMSKTGEWISKEDFATLCICAIRYCQGRRTYMPSLVQGIVRSHFGDIPDNYFDIMLRDCDFQRTMDLYGDEQIDKPSWLRWEQDLKDEIERRKNGI